MNLQKTCIVFLLCLTYSQLGLAQDKSVDKSGANTFKLFFEKVYLHTDRSYYSSGEDLWFSAYLVNGKSTSLTATSNNLYVELISSEAKIMDRKVIRLNEGLGKGNFKLKDSIASGWYTLRAYTNWMRNFGDNFVFNKQIYISSSLLNKGVLASAKKNTTVKLSSAPGSSELIQFFPEGGSLVNGITSIVAFKAEDNYGNGVKVSGKVISEKGDTLSTFLSTEAGMGIFAILPVAGTKYHVEGLYADQKKFNRELPVALTKGISMHVTTDSISIKIAVGINEEMISSLLSKDITVVIKHGGESFYSGKIRVEKAAAVVSIPMENLPQGIASITLYDEQGRPNCERLIFVPGRNAVNLSIVPEKTSYKAHEQVVLHVKASDASGQPVKTYLSLVAVDAIVPDDPGNIVSSLLLESEIRGKIQDAAKYFDPKNSGRLKQLDLVLLTQGWRDYLWKRIADSSLKVSYMPEPGITVAGKVREKIANKPLANMNITLIGNGFNGNKIYMTKTDPEGRYFLDGLNWDGIQSVKLSSKDDKGKKGGWLILDSLFKDPMKVDLQKRMPEPELSVFNAENEKQVAYNRASKFGDTIKLNEVNINADMAKTLVLRDQTLMGFGYPDQVYNITAADYDYKSLEHFLLTKVPGAQSASDSTQGVAFIAAGKKVTPRFIVNKREDVFERLDYYSLTMDQVNQVVVKHMLGNGGGDVYVISLNLKDSAFQGTELNILNTSLPGYDQSKVFYSPVYDGRPGPKKDLRTTIFWIPDLKTNEQGEATVKFYNADPKATISVNAEGITSKGAAVTTKILYKVQ